MISFSYRTDDLYDNYCIVKARPDETVHLIYQYLLLEGIGSEHYVIWMQGGFFKSEKRVAPCTHSPLAF